MKNRRDKNTKVKKERTRAIEETEKQKLERTDNTDMPVPLIMFAMTGVLVLPSH